MDEIWDAGTGNEHVKMDDLQATITALQGQCGFQFKPEEFGSVRFDRPPPEMTSPREAQRCSSLQNDVPNNVSGPKLLPLQCPAQSAINSSVATTDFNDSQESTENGSSSTKNWMLNSFGKAFSRKKTRTNSISDAELEAAESRTSSFVFDDRISPMQFLPVPGNLKRSFTLPSNLNPAHLDPDQRTPSAEDSDCLPSPFLLEKDDMVLELQRQLDERDAKMREIRQDAMSSVLQLQQLSAVVMEMRGELESLKAENDRLQMLVREDVPVEASPPELQARGRSVANTQESRRTDQACAKAKSASVSAAAVNRGAAVDSGRVSEPGSNLRVIKHV